MKSPFFIGVFVALDFSAHLRGILRTRAAWRINSEVCRVKMPAAPLLEGRKDFGMFP